MADFAALRRADAAGFAGGERWHVVCSMKRSRHSPPSASMIRSSRLVPRVATTSAWVSPRVNSAEPWVRGSTPVRIEIGERCVSRPSMRGSPRRICSRTVFASSANSSFLMLFLGQRVGVGGMSDGLSGSRDLELSRVRARSSTDR